MKKISFIITAAILLPLLTACGPSKHEKCKKLSFEASAVSFNGGGRSLGDIRKDWDKLQCTQSDVAGK